MFRNEKINTLLVFAISFIVLFVFYNKAILNINSYVFAEGGDGIKNYYTYIFHAKYDSSFFNFTGMNYPYGENIVFTDAHPLLSYVVGKLGLANYGIGIVNFLMLVSYPIASMFIYKIFKFFKVEVLWAILASVAITFMSPQVFRLTGHFSMSYVFAVPILWYLLIKTTQLPTIKWQLITTIYLLIFFFTHPYLGLILAVFALAYWFVYLIAKHKTKGIFKTILINTGMQVLLPILIFRVLVMIFDTHNGRLNNPSGFFDLHATFDSILIAHHGPILAIKPFFGWSSGNWESWAYIGVTTMVFSIISLTFLLINYKNINIKKQFNSLLFIFLAASCLVLVFAMCIPFRWDMFKGIVEYLGPLKQFRVLGRFAWVFFYVFTVFSVITFYRVKQKSKNKVVLNLIFYSGIIMYVLEFYPTHKLVSNDLTKVKNPFKIENTSDELQSLTKFTKQSNFDAVLFLPFTHMSSESVFILGSEQANYDAFMLSYHANIPLLNTVSSRTSLPEAITMINLFSPEFIDKGIANIIGIDKKLLLIINKDQLNNDEQRMVKSSSLIYENNTFKAYSFSLQDWNNRKSFDEVLLKSEQAKFKLENDWYADSTTWFYYDGFEQFNDKNAMFGNGAFAQQKIGWNNLIKLDSSLLKDGDYTLSFWYNIDIGKPDVLAVAEKITIDTLNWVDEFMVRETNLVVDNWAYIELNFNFISTDIINILLTSGPTNEWMVIDELLIRETNGNDLFKQVNFSHPLIGKDRRQFISYNNHWINKSSFK